MATVQQSISCVLTEKNDLNMTLKIIQGTNQHRALTFHFQAETLRAEKAVCGVVEPSGSCSLWHDESGSQPVPLPEKNKHFVSIDLVILLL